MPRGLSHYKIIVVCYVSGAKSLREFVFCVSTRTQRKKKSKDYQEFIEECKTSHMERRFTQQGLQPMCEAGCLHGEKQNNAARPLPFSRSAPPPPTPLTCIAGLVGVKIDRQSLNWKWSLNAGYSCWGFEFSLTPANQAADGENWRGICRRAEQWGHEEWIDPASAYPGAQASAPRTRAGPQITTVELRWAMLRSARPAMRTRVLEHRVTCWSWIQLQTTMAVTVRKPKNLCPG